MRIDRTIEIIGENPKQTQEQIEKKLKNYEKFQAKVNRLTDYGHTKRMMARMEYQKNKAAEEKKHAAVKLETVS